MSRLAAVPWLGGCDHRERALAWVLGQLSVPAQLAKGGIPWVKASAIVPVVEAADAEIVIVHDADVFCPGLHAAIEAVADGAPWARPHGSVHRLTQEGTAAVLAGADWREQPLDQRPYTGVWGGGIVVARRETILDVPPDPRFVGWGQEDASWGIALHHLLGSAWCGTAPLVHLWHPPQERETRKYGSAAGRALWRRYVAARSDPKLMRELIEEAHVALSAAQPPLLGSPAI